MSRTLVVCRALVSVTESNREESRQVPPSWEWSGSESGIPGEWRGGVAQPARLSMAASLGSLPRSVV